MPRPDRVEARTVFGARTGGSLGPRGVVAAFALGAILGLGASGPLLAGGRPGATSPPGASGGSPSAAASTTSGPVPTVRPTPEPGPTIPADPAWPPTIARFLGLMTTDVAWDPRVAPPVPPSHVWIVTVSIRSMNDVAGLLDRLAAGLPDLGVLDVRVTIGRDPGRDRLVAGGIDSYVDPYQQALVFAIDETALAPFGFTGPEWPDPNSLLPNPSGRDCSWLGELPLARELARVAATPTGDTLGVQGCVASGADPATSPTLGYVVQGEVRQGLDAAHAVARYLRAHGIAANVVTDPTGFTVVARTAGAFAVKVWWVPDARTPDFLSGGWYLGIAIDAAALDRAGHLIPAG